MINNIERASSQHLTHKFASFHGCTLGEMFLILSAYGLLEFPFILILSGFLAQYVGGYFGAFLLLFLVFSLLTFFVFLRVTAKQIGKIRKGRSAGYLTLRSRQLLHQHLQVSIPYVTQNTHWSTRRSTR